VPDPRQGVFETLLVVDGRPVELDAHLARLASSLEELFPGQRAPAVADRIEAAAGGSERAAIRATVAPDGDGDLREEIRSRPPRDDFRSLSDSSAPRSVELRAFERSGGLGAHKWADRSLLDEAQAGLPDDALPLIVDADGAALEASRANVFAVRDGALFTPPLDGRILPGITRARVIEIAAAGGIETKETELVIADLLAADEVFLTGSVRGIEPVASLDGAALPSGGPIASRLAAELRHAWLGAPVA
jgi:para-aminobenzoate synthetase/4-amino-4-deoxychorismate lyase